MLTMAQRNRAGDGVPPRLTEVTLRGQEAVPRHAKKYAWCVHESGVGAADHPNHGNQKNDPFSIASEK